MHITREGDSAIERAQKFLEGNLKQSEWIILWDITHAYKWKRNFARERKPWKKPEIEIPELEDFVPREESYACLWLKFQLRHKVASFVRFMFLQSARQLRGGEDEIN